MSFFVMILAAGAIIAIVRFALVAGLEQLAGALNWSPKARGQAMGYATSAPEFVTLVAAGLAGVWEAGLWNIASSNIINVVLMLAAAIRYGQLKELANRRFIDELSFAAAAIVVPLVLMKAGKDESWVVVPILLGSFLVYRVLDRRLNPATEEPAISTVGSIPLGLILTTTALVLIAVAGFFLGGATEDVVRQMGIHAAIAGWILGLVTSLPEMVSFFAVYATSKRGGTADGLDDTQEVLDNLAASNMANTGLIYPIGLAIYLVVHALAGG